MSEEASSAQKTEQRGMYDVMIMQLQVIALDMKRNPTKDLEKRERVKELFRENLDLDEIRSYKIDQKIKPITVLFLASNPKDTNPIDLITEYNAVDDEIIGGKFGDKIILKQRFEPNIDNISKYMLSYSPDIVHFSGHGNKKGEIILSDTTGKAEPLDKCAVADLFSACKENIRCVVLNACFTELQAMLISRHIDCVIGMSRAIADPTAIKFAQGFYRGLGFGKDIQTAFKLGCTQIKLKKLPGPDTPKIIWKNDEPKKIVFT